MNVTVFGATGNIGSRVVKLLLNNGFIVTAFVYKESQLPQHKNLRIVKGSIYNKPDVISALLRADAVISALGSWGTPKKDILSSAMVNIIPAMRSQNIKRIITLTGDDADTSQDKKTLFHTLTRIPILIIGRKIMQDSESHIQQIESSGLDWTILRSPIMTNEVTSSYELSTKRPFFWQIISRDAVAQTIVDQLNDKTYIRQAPFIIKRTQTTFNVAE